MSISRFFDLFRHIKRSETVPAQKAALITSASFAALGPVYFLVCNAISQLLHPAQNPISVTVSLLVFGSYGWLQTSAFYIIGISFIALAVALILKINARINLGAIVVFLVGLAFLLVACNHVQTPGTTIALSGIIHRDSAIGIVAMSPLACFLVAPNLKASGHKHLWTYSIIAGFISVITILIGFLIPAVHSSFLGIFERVLLLSGELWGEIICVRLVWTAFKSKRSSDKIMAIPSN